jgi:hypothetical protein
MSFHQRVFPTSQGNYSFVNCFSRMTLFLVNQSLTYLGIFTGFIPCLPKVPCFILAIPTGENIGDQLPVFFPCFPLCMLIEKSKYGGSCSRLSHRELAICIFGTVRGFRSLESDQAPP